MRAREYERFMKMNFSTEEIETRARLMRVNRKICRYKIIITTECEKKLKNHNLSEYITYFSNHPENGKYLDTIYFYTPSQYYDIVKLYEGNFYQLFDLGTGERIGYGLFDPDNPLEDIAEQTGDKCEGVCEFCFKNGKNVMFKNETAYYACN